jgi:hypothetical protein
VDEIRANNELLSEIASARLAPTQAPAGS